MSQLFVGLMAEGSTDYRFLKPIVEKTLINIAYECKGQVDIEVKEISYNKRGGFCDYVLNASQQGYDNYGINILVVHSDADASSSENTYSTKITPAMKVIEREEYLGISIAALVPIYETESWLLADKDLFRKIIGTKKTDMELNINGHPESFNNPKERIVEAIRIGRAHLPKKVRDNLNIGDLYSILGEATLINSLSTFLSYLDFENNIRKELVTLNLL